MKPIAAMMDRRFVVPYQRIGPGVAKDGQPKYDLSRFNPAFFDRLRTLCQAARAGHSSSAHSL